MNSRSLANFIDQNGITAQIVYLDRATLTVTDAAAALGVASEQIIKSILFLADGLPVLVIAGGTARIAWKRLADYLEISRRRLKTARADQVVAMTGYVVGAVPPFGHRRRIRTVVETAVYAQPIVYGGGGETNALLRLETAELRRIVGQETADLLEV